MNKSTFIGSLKLDRSVILMILATLTLENSVIFILVFCAANSAFEI